MPHFVSDSLSNTHEQIEQAAKAIGRSVEKRKVFETIYHGKKRVKSAEEISEKTGLSQKRVTMAGRHFASRHIVEADRQDGKTIYKKIDFFHTHKAAILTYAGNSKKLKDLPTKRKVIVALPRSVSVPSAGAKVRRITVDDVASFTKVRKVKPSGHLPATVSEATFKQGVEKIVREAGGKKDWGGERNDFHTTRLKLKTTRVGAAFAFKGPGKKAKTLTPGMMGKNGDQIQRLFQTDAEVFFVQYWRDIGEAVLEQMRTFAIVKSIADGNRVYYGVIDGADSNRLFQAYQSSFIATHVKRKRGA